MFPDKIPETTLPPGRYPFKILTPGRRSLAVTLSDSHRISGVVQALVPAGKSRGNPSNILANWYNGI